MGNKILSKLSRKSLPENNRIEKAARITAITLGISLMLAPPFVGGRFCYKLAGGRGPEKKEIIENVRKESSELARLYLKNNPETVENFFENYEGRKFLNKMLSEKKETPKNLTKISNIFYNEEDDELFKIDSNKNAEKIKSGIDQIVSCNDAVYFTKGEDIFGINQKKDIGKITSAENPVLNPVYGSKACAVYTDEGNLLISSDKDKKESKNIRRLLNKIPLKDDLEDTKLFYDKGKLYYGHNDKVQYVSDSTQVVRESYQDYILDDLNNDGEKELAISVSEKKRNRIDVYRENEKIYSIPCKDKIKNLEYQRDNSFLGSGFKKKVYDELGIRNSGAEKRDSLELKINNDP